MQIQIIINYIVNVLIFHIKIICFVISIYHLLYFWDKFYYIYNISKTI